MTKYPDLFADLAAPFQSHELKVRSQTGRQFSYITARTAMNRLDSVLGPENWWDEYTPQENMVICRLTVRLPDGGLVTKSDAGGHAGMQDSGDDEKSAFSDAFKRACAKFGIGRYLYGDGVPNFRAEIPQQQAQEQPATLPIRNQRRPEPVAEAPAPAAAPESSAPIPDRAPGGNGTPKNGKGLFAWAKDQDARGDVQMLKYLTHWGKLQEYPTRMVEWDAEQVSIAYSEAQRRLQQVAHARHEAREAALAN